MPPSHEVIVIGGGPAGSTTAALLAGFGHDVVVLERAKFPRHHIGESLMPNTYFTFQRLGLLEQMKQAGFVVKQSVQFVTASGKDSAPFFFPDRDPGEWSYTWQVERSRFDEMLLNHARGRGATVFEQAGVREVIFDGQRAVGVQANIAGEPRELRAKVIVDATGQSGLISRQLRLRYGDEKLKNSAIYSYYKGAMRDEDRNAGATLVIATPTPGGWFWFIPLSSGVTSVGVVAPPGALYEGRRDDPGAILDEEIRKCPGAARRLERAERVAPIYTAADFSYRSQRFAGEGWVLVGDAFGFLDPLYSSGVMLALKSAEFAADNIHQGLQVGDTSAGQLGKEGQRLADGMQRIRQFVYAYYDPSFRMSRFVREHPEFKDDITRVLIGDVFGDDLHRLFDVLGETINLPEPIALRDQAPMA